MASLPIGSSNGQQTNTQSPQAGAPADSSTAQAASVQPGTTSSLLNSTKGISLEDQALTNVGFGSVTQQAGTQPAQHHVNSVLLGFSLLLLIAAAALWLLANRSAKSTT